MSSPSQPSPYATPATLTDRLRRLFQRVVDPATTILMRLGVRPNMLTLLGTLLHLIVGLLAASGHLTFAGLTLFVFAPLDALDGALARRLEVQSRFGAFFDSTLDRYADAFVLFGLMVYAGDRGLRLELYLVFVTLAGALLISYTRARAEALGVECKVGLLSRVERYFILSAMLTFQLIRPGLIVLSILTHVTALQRIVHVWRSMRRVEQGVEE